MRAPARALPTSLRIAPALVLSLALGAGACTRLRLPLDPAPVPMPAPASTASKPDAAGAVAAGEPRAALLPDLEHAQEYVRERALLVPVAGARLAAIEDSFDEPRDGGRRHHAIDILAPRGTPVLAADDGRVLRLSRNPAGGITIYAVDPAGLLVYYYAHLDHYRDSIAVGMPLVRGDTIGFVGTTGNAPANTPHLHFQVMRMPGDGKYWNGEPIDPLPFWREEGRGATAEGARRQD